MAVKTITIDVEAYNLLAAEKGKSESFSKVIKRRLRPGRTAADLLKNLSRLTLDEDALDRVEDTVARRRASRINSPILNDRT